MDTGPPFQGPERGEGVQPPCTTFMVRLFFFHHFQAHFHPRIIIILMYDLGGSWKEYNSYITHICNVSKRSNTFPDVWKSAKIKPLHKKGSNLNLSNYRPISILPTLSKVLEKHVAIHLSKYLNGHELLSPNQSGFLSNHSCEKALLHMLDG